MLLYIVALLHYWDAGRKDLQRDISLHYDLNKTARFMIALNQPLQQPIHGWPFTCSNPTHARTGNVTCTKLASILLGEGLLLSILQHEWSASRCMKIQWSFVQWPTWKLSEKALQLPKSLLELPRLWETASQKNYWRLYPWLTCYFQRILAHSHWLTPPQCCEFANAKDRLTTQVHLPVGLADAAVIVLHALIACKETVSASCLFRCLSSMESSLKDNFPSCTKSSVDQRLTSVSVHSHFDATFDAASVFQLKWLAVFFGRLRICWSWDAFHWCRAVKQLH